MIKNTQSRLQSDDNEYDGLFVIFSCHGTSKDGIFDQIVLSDGNVIGVKQIKSRFNGSSLPRYVTKPKVFAFDCCRGDARAKLISDKIS